MAKVRYKGKTYSTKRELAEALDINYDTLNMRMSRGLSLKAAIEFRPKSTVRYKKKNYNSYQHLIDELDLGLTVNQLQYRLKRCGGSLTKAIAYQVPKTEVVYEGYTYTSLKVLCDEMGLIYSTIKNRINRQGKSIEEAILMTLDGGERRPGPKPRAPKVMKKRGRPTKKVTAIKKKAAEKKRSVGRPKSTVKSKRGPGRPRKSA